MPTHIHMNKDAYDHYRDQFDYFYAVGDDTFVVVDNLRAYLQGPEVQRLKDGYLDVFAQSNPLAKERNHIRPRPLLLGLPATQGQPARGIYPLGGCGYLLNQASLDLLVRQGLPTFLHNLTDPREDVFVGGFLWSQGVSTADTRDSTGAFRCQSKTAEDMYSGSSSQIHAGIMQKRHNVTVIMGMEGVSKQTTAFHLKGGKRSVKVHPKDLMYRYHALLAPDSPCYPDDQSTTKTETVTNNQEATSNNAALGNEPDSLVPPEIPTLYWNLSCPLESSKLSQVFMGSVARARHMINDTSTEDIHGLRRAHLARAFSEQHHSLQRVAAALRSHSFDGRRIIFEGDSLTRQLFTALACLAWGNGYMESERTDWKEWDEAEYNKLQSHFPGFFRKGRHSMLVNSVVQLKGGGQLVYRDRYPVTGNNMYRNSVSLQRYDAWTGACSRNETILSVDQTPLTSSDVIVINAGLHPDRNTQFDKIRTLVRQCQGAQYPKFVYMLTPLQHFWTKKGTYDARALVDDKWTCRPSVPDFQRQYGDIEHFEPLAPLLGQHLDQRDLGDLMIWRGDCTHWIMPGMHDVLAAELADVLQNWTTTMTTTTTTTRIV